MSRIDMQKNNGGVVSVHVDKVADYEAMGYTVYKEPEDTKPYNELISDAAQVKEVDTQEAIIQAIYNLSPDDFSKSTGKPNVKAIENVLGFDITAKQRNDAWSAYQDALEEH